MERGGPVAAGGHRWDRLRRARGGPSPAAGVGRGHGHPVGPHGRARARADRGRRLPAARPAALVTRRRRHRVGRLHTQHPPARGGCSHGERRDDTIGQALARITATDTRGWFTHCGYRVPAAIISPRAQACRAFQETVPAEADYLSGWSALGCGTWRRGWHAHRRCTHPRADRRPPPLAAAT